MIVGEIMPAIELNQDQKDAVEYFSKKPLLIQAGPGSGKTRVIIERVKYLIQEKKVDPETFLVVTFSNKATNELRERLIDSENGLDIETVNKIHISTIHSFCYDLISNQGLSYDILEEDEKNHMFIYKHLYDLGFDYEKYFKRGHIESLVKKFNEMTTFNVDIDGFEEYVKDEFPVCNEYLEYIKSILNDLKADESFNFPEEDVKDDELLSEAWYNARYNQVAESYRRYLDLLKKENYIDFSLIQTKALELLETYPDLVEELGFKMNSPSELASQVSPNSSGKLIDVDLSEQKLRLYQDGELIVEYSASTGKSLMPTPTGNFQILSKEENHWSSKYGLYMPYALNFYGDYYIHELPYWPGGYREGEEHLGTPVSHGCVRVGIGAAETVYNFAEIGTEVVIHK